MKILVINCGSSSIKYRVYESNSEGGLNSLAEGGISGLGSPDAILKSASANQDVNLVLDRPDHRAGLEAIMNLLKDNGSGVLNDLSEIDLVGHRTVHGGDKFTGAVFVTQEVIEKMKHCIPLAPVHNPANLEGIRLVSEMLPQTRHVAVFDTAYHQTLPQKAYLYGLPYELYEKHGIRKYGFHGTSCQYIAFKATELADKSSSQCKSVICHLGNGVTVAAIKDGRSVDTSMGLTPLEGAMMGTRCGDLDPGVLLYLQRELKLGYEQIDKMLNSEAGLLGVSGLSNDMRQIISFARQGNERCKLALEMYTYRIKKYIGAYAAAMGGIDLLAFAGGVGENSPLVREMILEDMSFLGFQLDRARNEEADSEDVLLSAQDSKSKIALVHTNEELMIAREALDLMTK